MRCTLSPLSQSTWTLADSDTYQALDDASPKPLYLDITDFPPKSCIGFSLSTSASTIEVCTTSRGASESSYACTSRGLKQELVEMKHHSIALVIGEAEVQSVSLKLMSLPKPGTSCVVRSLVPLIGLEEGGVSSQEVKSQGQGIRDILEHAANSDQAPSSSLGMLAREIAKKALLADAPNTTRGSLTGQLLGGIPVFQRLEDAVRKVEAIEVKMEAKMHQLDKIISHLSQLAEKLSSLKAL